MKKRNAKRTLLISFILLLVVLGIASANFYQQTKKRIEEYSDTYDEPLENLIAFKEDAEQTLNEANSTDANSIALTSDLLDSVSGEASKINDGDFVVYSIKAKLPEVKANESYEVWLATNKLEKKVMLGSLSQQEGEYKLNSILTNKENYPSILISQKSSNTKERVVLKGYF